MGDTLPVAVKEADFVTESDFVCDRLAVVLTEDVVVPLCDALGPLLPVLVLLPVPAPVAVAERDVEGVAVGELDASTLAEQVELQVGWGVAVPLHVGVALEVNVPDVGAVGVPVVECAAQAEHVNDADALSVAEALEDEEGEEDADSVAVCVLVDVSVRVSVALLLWDRVREPVALVEAVFERVEEIVLLLLGEEVAAAVRDADADDDVLDVDEALFDPVVEMLRVAECDLDHVGVAVPVLPDELEPVLDRVLLAVTLGDAVLEMLDVVDGVFEPEAAALGDIEGEGGYVAPATLYV